MLHKTKVVSDVDRGFCTKRLVEIRTVSHGQEGKKGGTPRNAGISGNVDEKEGLNNRQFVISGNVYENTGDMRIIRKCL
jgi:hypothetical protein